VNRVEKAQESSVITDITVAISTADRADVLDRCLSALLLGEALPAEIVVVDQSNDERTRAVVEKYAGGAVPMVYVRHHGSGLGISQNLAFAHASAAIVAVTDDDCVPASDWMAIVAKTVGGDKGVNAMTGRVLSLGPNSPDLYPVSTRMSTVRVNFTPDAMPWEIGSGNNFAVERAWLQRIGGNDERLGPGSPGKGGVDMDLFYRLLRAGAQVRYEPDAVVYHEQTTRRGRIKRRIPYGYGMGACCTIWLRRGERQAWGMLCKWLFMRLRRLGRGIWLRQWLLAYEEILVLFGTARGLIYGLTLHSE
jgi:GT2 family glycosyltransferase